MNIKMVGDWSFKIGWRFTYNWNDQKIRNVHKEYAIVEFKERVKNMAEGSFVQINKIGIYNRFLLLSNSYVVESWHKCWNSDYRTISSRVNTGLDSWEPMIIIFL